MAFKSVIDIDVNDAKFKEFNKNFEKYQAAVAKLPKAWKQQGNAVGALKDNLVDVSAVLMAQNEMLTRSVRETERLDRTAQGVNRSFVGVLNTVTRISISLAKWGFLTGIGGGLITAFGINRMASSAGQLRQSSLGLGTSVGREAAFRNNYGQFVDAGSLLGSVAGAQTDISKRWAFGAMGVNARGDAAGVAGGVVDAARRYRTQLLAPTGEQFARAHGFLEFTSMDELRRIARAPQGSIDAARRGMASDAGRMNVGSKALEAWNTLDIQLDKASKNLRAIVLNGLAPLVPSITKFTEAFTRAVDTFVNNKRLQGWIEDIGTEVEKFANYLQTADFSENVKSFIDNIAKLGHAVGWIVSKLPDSVTGGNTVSTNPFHMGVTRFGDKSVNNPLNLRPVGDDQHFMQYGSADDGANAAKRQLLKYGSRGINTISGIVSKWAPERDHNGKVINNTAAYISDVSKRTGFAPDQKLDLNDAPTMSKLMTAMAIHEGNKVEITINNNTGGNAVVSARQLPQ